MSKTISVRLPDALTSSIALIAKQTEMSKSFHIQKAVETYLEEIADMQVAADRLNNLDDTIISANDMRKELGLY